jgi:hypothetical protein
MATKIHSPVNHHSLSEHFTGMQSSMPKKRDDHHLLTHSNPARLANLCVSQAQVLGKLVLNQGAQCLALLMEWPEPGHRAGLPVIHLLVSHKVGAL